ncbi:MAG: DUF624 domain-containing protein [Bacilli bacterium]
MKFEKLFNSKFYMFFEWLYRMIIINLLFILCSVLGLIVFSIVPSFIAMITIIKSLSTETSFPIVRPFFRIFLKHFKQNIVLSLVFLVLTLMFLFNTYFFFLAWQEYQALINEIIFNFTLVLDGILIVSFINALFIRVYFPNLNTLKTLKYAIILLRAMPMQFLLVFLLLIVMAVLLYYFPYFLIIMGFSIVIYIVNLLIRTKYSKLVATGVISLQAQDYL